MGLWAPWRSNPKALYVEKVEVTQQVLFFFIKVFAFKFWMKYSIITEKQFSILYTVLKRCHNHSLAYYRQGSDPVFCIQFSYSFRFFFNCKSKSETMFRFAKGKIKFFPFTSKTKNKKKMHSVFCMLMIMSYCNMSIYFKRC